MKIEDFRKLLNKYKPYRNLSDEYKTDKFLLLYLKIYEYMLSIPKEEIVYNRLKTQLVGYGLLRYIEYFLKAKDFNNWRYRVYELMTKKLNSTTLKKFELLYNSKAKELHDIYSKKYSESMIQYSLENFGTKNPMQSKEVKEKSKKTFKERYNVENPSQIEEVKEKKKQHFLETLGCENPFQDEEVKEKIRKRNLERRGVENPAQDPEVQAKIVATNLKRYNRPRVGGWLDIGTHSNIADDLCASLYNMLPGNIECVFFAKDQREYSIENRYYDFCIPDLKIIIEFDGLYWHGLQEGQKFVRDTPVEDIWNRDREKQKLAEDNGFKVIRVREDEYRENKNLVLNRIYKLIMEI